MKKLNSSLLFYNNIKMFMKPYNELVTISEFSCRPQYSMLFKCCFLYLLLILFELQFSSQKHIGRKMESKEKLKIK
jgi:hypothetical protein